MLYTLALIFVLFSILIWRHSIAHSTHFGAPFVGLEPKVIQRVFQLAPLRPHDIFFDLGSGDGRLVIAAGLAGANAYGIETDILRVLYSRLVIRLFGLSRTCHILHQDIFKTNLAPATVVHLYLLQETANLLAPQLKSQLQPGTQIVSSAFTLPGFKLLKTDPHGPPFGPLYLYQR